MWNISKIVCLVSLLITTIVNAQNVLPDFSVTDKGNGRVIISWKNKFVGITQISVQRSYDSLKKFSTIYSSPSPELPENGFTDKINPDIKVYYRIFFVQQGGAYFFSESKSPGFGTQLQIDIGFKRDKATEYIEEEFKSSTKKIHIKTADTYYKSVYYNEYITLKDSIIYHTRDTLTLLSTDTILIKKYSPPFEWKASYYVYTDKDGYIIINLPGAANKVYDLIIMEEDGKPVLELKHIKHTYLTLDKTNFYHAGWYKFELVEDGKIKDRNKLFIPKDF